MTSILRNDAQFVSGTDYLQKFVTYMEQSVVRILNNKRRPEQFQNFLPCNSDGAGFVRGYSANMDLLGVPMPDASCVTSFEGLQTFPDEKSAFSAMDLDIAIRNRTSRIFSSRQDISDKVVGNWTSPDVGRNFVYRLPSRECVVNSIYGIRKGPTWYLSTIVTNRQFTKNLPLFARQYLLEFTTTSGNGQLDAPLKMRLNIRPPDGDNSAHIRQNDTTTALISDRGAMEPNYFGKVFAEDIPAYETALDMSNLNIQQVEDALTPSSLAILLMPLGLNLLPIGILTKVGTFSMFLYTIFSDVLTVVPLAIKGVELFVIGKQRQFASHIRMSSAANGSLPETAFMELWTAECHSKKNIVTVGAVFLSLSLFFIVLGVLLEFWAMWFVSKRRRSENSAIYESAPLVDSTDKIVLPTKTSAADRSGNSGESSGATKSV